MIKYLWFLVSFLLVSCISQARERLYNTMADKLFTDSAYHSLLKKQCQKVVQENGTAAIHFESNYAIYRDSIISLSQTLIEKKFNEIETKCKGQKIKDKLAMQLFEKALNQAVVVTLSKNQSLRNALSAKDLNDRILSFDSKINIQQDGTLDVMETITIANFSDENSNNTIQRGITRDFPTRYTSPKGFISTVPFTLHSISRNGEIENFHTEKLSNGLRIFCGKREAFLEDGIHTYVIRYSTAKQLKFHSPFDEFYWNVSGNGWSFSIDKASCEIYFPAGASIIDRQCYTGLQGEQKHDCNYSNTGENQIKFYTNKRLNPYQGLTISVSVKKGILQEESHFNQFKSFVVDNKAIAGLVLFVILLFLSLYFHWKKVGKDPEQGVVIPEFTPPDGLSPADVGYIYHQEYNDKLLSAALIDLAVQKKLQIEVEREGILFKSNVYTFSAPELQKDSEIPRDYEMYTQYGFDASDLFGMKIERGSYNPAFSKISTSFKNNMDAAILTKKKDQTEKGFLSLNQDYIGIGLFLLILAIIGSFIYITIVQPPGLSILYIIVLLAIGMAIQIFFMKIIKAYSAKGRKMADKILGFKMYMETTEKNVLDRLNPPEDNIQLFEKYLPYAIALGIENKWSDRFKGIVEQALNGGYQPSYYKMSQHGSFSESSQSFASAFGSGLSNTVSSASTPPSSNSSSGSGGGGSSGGGGGGGGGGGW
ncbi:MAG: DUF2207 domain-containing protein [Bacteroidetes bacterium]|nr:DUF2207 domain-containing protein [Bacteroidota bacterium]